MSQNQIETRATGKPLYRALGLPDDCSHEEIRAAYLNIAKALHPDKNGGAHHPAFAAAQKAFDVLGAPELRRRYDETGLEDSDEMRIESTALKLVVESILKQVDDGAELEDIPLMVARLIAKDKRMFEANIRASKKNEIRISQQIAGIKKVWIGGETLKAVLFARLDDQIRAMKAETCELQMRVSISEAALKLLEGIKTAGGSKEPANPFFRMGSDSDILAAIILNSGLPSQFRG